MSEKIEFLSAVLLISKNADKLASFYRDIVGIPLEVEQHGSTEKHYGCELGDLHFAIHPASNFAGKKCDTGAIKLAFTVFNLYSFVERIKSAGVKIEYEPKDMGFAIMTALLDPDGNYVEFTQLSGRWIQHLKNRRQQGIDMISKWQVSNPR